MDVIGCIILLAFCDFCNCKKIEPKPVSEIDLYKISGRFYNIYVPEGFEEHFAGDPRTAVCQTTVFKVKNNTTFSGINSWRDDTVDGILHSIIGDVQMTEQPRTFMFSNSIQRMPYWIVDLGPVIDNKYEYMIIAFGSKRFIFERARNITRFDELYDSEVKKWLKEHGSATRRVDHPEGCQYYVPEGFFV